MAIQRWVFLLVVLVVFLGLGVGGVWFVVSPWVAAWSAPKELPSVVVEAVYPGASAEVVAETVAAPIEQQVSGVEDLVAMRSQSRDDGTYKLTLAFRPGTDLKIAQILVHNRVSLATPILPDVVKQAGFAVTKKSSFVLCFVALTSPDGRFDSAYLSNYATIQIKDELARTRGVGEVVLFGRREHQLRVDLDREKLAAVELTKAIVVGSLREQNLAVEPGPQDSLLILSRLGRSVEPEELASVILKSAMGEDRPVRLKDVAHLGVTNAREENHARLDGQPAVVLAVYPLPEAPPHELLDALQQKLTLLREHLPDGLALEVALDFSPRPDYLRLDLELPAAAALDRTVQVVERCAASARQLEGVDRTLSLCGAPVAAAPNQACILLRLDRARGRKSPEELAQALRTALNAQIKDAQVRVCDLSRAPGFSTGGYPIELAFQELDSPDQTQQLAEKLADRLTHSDKVCDVWSSVTVQPEQLAIVVDRDKARALGVSLQDVFNTLQVFLGSTYVNDFNSWGRTLVVKVQGPAAQLPLDQLKQLQIRNFNGEIIRLATLVEIRQEKGRGVIDRLDFRPIVRITANPAAGVSLAEARTFCEEQFNAVRSELGLPAKYRLIRTEGLPTMR